MGRNELGVLLAAVLICMVMETPVGAEDNKQIIVNGRNETIETKIPSSSIVIHTQIQNYENPSFKEYEECQENAAKCAKVCAGTKNKVDCLKQCPKCPVLMVEDLVVQGLNDTKVRPAKPLNTTNVIRLTNQIHNIIDMNQGNITVSNNNTIHSSVSRTGGPYGLGFNNTDPCCIVLSQKKICDSQQFSTSARCHHKRHRVCGQQCKSRVMVAKKVNICDDLDESNWSDEVQCRQTVKYVPHVSHVPHVPNVPNVPYIPRVPNVPYMPHVPNVPFVPYSYPSRAVHRCGPSQVWPFVRCNNQGQSFGHCSNCLRLPFVFLLRNGIPNGCISCFSDYSPPHFDGGYMFNYQPQYGGRPPLDLYSDPPIIDDNLDVDESGGWSEVSRKILLPDGTINSIPSGSDGWLEPEGTMHLDGSGENIDLSPNYSLADVEDDFNGYGDPEDFSRSMVRRRRKAFTRSKYSRRYQHQ
uniref:Uncharacterized protein n=2 Tax=Stomoxys calcitrans TaxID=35570 RepID=A0A1I8P5T5_STOCA